MFKTLYSKLAIVLLLLFGLIGLSVLIVTQYSTEMYQQEVNQKLNRDLARQIAENTDLIKDGRINGDALKEIFHMLMLVNPSIELYLLDPDGNVLAFSAPSGRVKRRVVDIQPIMQWIHGRTRAPLLGDDPRSLKGKKAFSAARVTKNDQLLGYLYVILSGEGYDSVVEKLKGSYILKLTAWWILASLLFTFAAGLLFFGLLTRRLRRLAAAMDSYGEGPAEDHTTAVPMQGKRSGDEIDRLDADFRRMVARIEYQIGKITRLDAKRRELIANVSHDLRTPLANLQGYIETLLLKDQQLDPKERKRYLEIANKHCHWLSTLVKELFELAKLEADEAVMHREPFNIMELAHDVIQKFDLTAKEKQIRLQVEIEQDLPVVDADIALIERVLENLLENAIRCTPEKGLIQLMLTREQDKVAIRVQDSGYGISEEDLPHIFDRFHHRSHCADVKEGRVGLGLAITKRIVELHGGSISVESTTGRGTTFRFQLPLHQAT
ncbi:MAG: GHKL domain-containing protein [Deltaproteobacteria bacterium]|nr:GHKL domain-containing protein [Deltaproteobacteria bacterium]